MSNQSEQAVAEKQSRRARKQARKKGSAHVPVKKIEATGKQTRKQQKQNQKKEKISNKKPRLRIFPIWLRIIIVLILATAALVAGLMIGYGILGDGIPTDVLKKETWQHIIDIVTKVE